ncbi:MAG: hypothetical protein AAGN46_05925 [Acidobacteriota bacterium]
MKRRRRPDDRPRLERLLQGSLPAALDGKLRAPVEWTPLGAHLERLSELAMERSTI